MKDSFRNTIPIDNKIPNYPDKDKIIDLLSKTHNDNIPNWTTKELEEAHKQLKSLAFFWFRIEV